MTKRNYGTTFTIGALVLANGQRLRADETATVTTFRLRYAAERASAREAVR